MENGRIKRIDTSVQQWLRSNKRISVTPELVIGELVNEGFYDTSSDSLELFIQEIRTMTKKEQREYLNIYRIGEKDIRFKNRENF